MKKKHLILSLTKVMIVCLVCLPRAEAGGPWYVTSSGTPGDGQSWVQAFTNIQTAIDTATEGDTIYLAAHTFMPPASALGIGKLIWTNKSLTILGGYAVDGGSPGALAAIPTTITNAATYQASTNRIMYISGVTNGTLARVKLVGGKIGYPTSITVVSADFYGAGLYMANCTNMSLESLVFDANAIGVQQSGDGDGAGLYVTNSWGTISNSVFQNNLLGSYAASISRGGGLHVAGGGWSLRDCIIRDNMRVAQYSFGDTCQGIGLYFSGGTHFVRNSVISRNYGNSNASYPKGDALYLASGTVTVENCTFYWHHYEGVRCFAGALTLRDCIVWECGDDIAGTVTLQNCDIQDGDSNGVSGIISSDPLFERGLYLSPGSPCVNAGSRTVAAAGVDVLTTQADGSLDAGVVDMGYHFPAGHPADLFVSVNSGDDSYPGTNAAAPFKTIGKALAVADDGVYINVAAGLYTTNTETFPLLFPANVYGIQLLGTNAAETILDARQRNARVLGMTCNYPGARVTGVTLRGADYQMPVDGGIGRGGGLYASHSRGAIEDCVVVSNKIRSSLAAGAHYGGGVCVERSNFIISNCAIGSNSVQSGDESAYGGGIAWESSDGMMDRCTIINNQAIPGNYIRLTTRGVGGGVYLSIDDGGVVMRNCLIAGNNAVDGKTNAVGGGVCNVSTVAVVNCTIVSNRATGLYGASLAALTNCIVWGNGNDVTGAVTAAYSDIGTGSYTNGGSNKSEDPLFVTAPASYRISKTGPCCNAGVFQPWMVGALDLDGKPRKSGGAPDMGCYEMDGTQFLLLIY